MTQNSSLDSADDWSVGAHTKKIDSIKTAVVESRKTIIRSEIPQALSMGLKRSFRNAHNTVCSILTRRFASSKEREILFKQQTLIWESGLLEHRSTDT